MNLRYGILKYVLLGMFIFSCEIGHAMRATFKRSTGGVETNFTRSRTLVREDRTQMSLVRPIKRQKTETEMTLDLRGRNALIEKKYRRILLQDSEHSTHYQHLTSRRERSDYFVGVTTTKIFCRFGCPVSPPLAKNTLFSSRPVDLISMGLRECKRCHPLSHGAEGQVLETLRGIESSPVPSKIGTTPLDPAARWLTERKNIDLVRYVQAKRVMSILANTQPTRYNSESVLTYQRYWTPVGFMLGCFTPEGLCLLEFMDRRALESELTEIQKRLKATFKEEETEFSQLLESELQEYFQGIRERFSTPLHLVGSEFQKSVWEVLRRIPYGATMTYKDQAAELGTPEAVRAVANANGANRISIIIPCHRVIGSNNKLTGYGGGLERKEYLLNLEKMGH